MRHIHWRDPQIPKVSLCFDQRLQDWQLTDDPKQVTCKRCRKMMERRQRLESKDISSERQELELGVHNALWQLSDYFKQKDDPLQYEVNRLWRKLDELRAIPEFPHPQQN